MTAFARVRVEAARPDDVDRVAALLAEAGSWMLGRGIRRIR